MNTRTTLLVLLIALLLGGYFVLFETNLVVERLTKEEPAYDAAAGRPLFAGDELSAPDVQRVVLEPLDGSRVVIERASDPQGWMQIEPVRWPIDTVEMSRLVDEAAGLRYFDVLEGAVAEAFDADPPRMVMTLMTGGEGGEPAERVIEFGKSLAGSRAHVRLGDQPEVYLVPDDLHAMLLDEPLTALRERDLADFQTSRVERIGLTRREQSIELARDERGQWHFAGETTGRASDGAAADLIDAINQARAESFVADQPEDLAQYGLDQPARTLRLTITGATEDAAAEGTRTVHTLRIEAAADLEGTRYFAAFNDAATVFTLPASRVEALNRTVNELRDPRLTPAARSRVREIELQRDETTIRFVQQAGVWQFGDPTPAFDLETSAVGALLDAVFETRARGHRPADAVGDAFASIALAVAGEEEPERLTLHRLDTAGELAVVRAGEQVAAVVDREELRPLLAEPRFFRDRTVWDLDSAQIRGIDITASGDYPAEYQLRRVEPEDGGPGVPAWDIEGYDRDVVDNLLAVLTRLRCDRWVDEDLAEADRTITLTLADGSRRTLTIDTDLSLGRTSEGVMHFNASQLQTLTAELRDRVALDLDIERIASISTPGWTISRSEAGRYELAGDGELNEPAAATLFDTLAGLTVERYVPANWAGYRAETPTRTLTITPRDGEPTELRIWSAESTDRPVPIATDGEAWFTLGPRTTEALLTDPVR